MRLNKLVQSSACTDALIAGVEGGAIRKVTTRGL